MKTQNLRAALLLILTFVVCGDYAFGQSDKFKVPNNIINPSPILEWKAFNADAKGSDGKTYMGLTFSIKNWKLFPDQMFAAAPELPACGLNKNSSQTWLDIYDFATDKRIYGFCGLKKGEDMNSLSFNVKREEMPECVYITLTDRKKNKTLKSNPIKFTNGDNSQCQQRPKTRIG